MRGVVGGATIAFSSRADSSAAQDLLLVDYRELRAYRREESDNYARVPQLLQSFTRRADRTLRDDKLLRRTRFR